MPTKGSKPAKKAPVKKAPVKKAPAKKAVVKKAAVKAAPAKALKKKAAPAPAKKAPAKKAVVKKQPVAKKAPVVAKKQPVRKAPAPKQSVKQPPVKQTTVKQTKPPTKAAAPVAKRTKPVVLDKFALEQIALLEEERRIYTEQAESLKAEADQLALEMEPGDIQFDEESGEGGTTNIDRERDLALSAQARAAVEEIEHALVKVRNGTYGICESCGQPILKARLKALPYARLCVACKSGGLSRR